MSLMEEKWITSVGIDLGTSTTKWIVSRLKLMKTSGGYSLPRYEITERRLDYVSPIYSTPLISEIEIDIAALSQLLEHEYERAGVSPEMIDTGAIIITGETATKRNAEQIVQTLAKQAGQFVVATAGADLEAQLAGKGSGAEAYSAARAGVVVNVDIGGGTANAAYFRDGEMVATLTLHIGGRLIRIDQYGRVEYVASQLKLWAARHAQVKIPLEGEVYSFAFLGEFCRQLVKALLDSMLGGGSDDLEELIVSATLKAPLPVPDEIWISGGVGSLMGELSPQNIEEAARFGDVGPYLAAALNEQAALSTIPLRQAKESARATVIGAGTQTTEISGSTLFYDADVLPLRNVPVVVCLLTEAANGFDEAVKAAMNRGIMVYNGDSVADPPFALALRNEGYLTYKQLQRLADSIVLRYTVPLTQVLLVICENDMAKALGHALRSRLPASIKLICIDQIRPDEGDYIDVGKPLNEDIIPVVIKTLVFNKREAGGG